MSTIPLATTWQTTPPPTDRAIIITSNICGEDQYGHYVTPFNGLAKWTAGEGSTGHWINEASERITQSLDEELFIVAWIDRPSAASFPPQGTSRHEAK